MPDPRIPDARAVILARIRGAALSPAPDIPRAYHGPGHTPPADPVALLTQRVRDYRAGVHHCTVAQVPERLAELTAGHQLVVAPGFPAHWWPPAGLTDDPPLTVNELDTIDAVLTTCALAIATTGTIVLDHGPGQGRRALTLVPDRHLVLVRAHQIVATVPDAIALLDPHRPQTWISGPSATSDIELNRVEGVHGPRTLEVLIVS
jgi:L-lactate dehydrogenase complex protein LldG